MRNIILYSIVYSNVQYSTTGRLQCLAKVNTRRTIQIWVEANWTRRAAGEHKRAPRVCARAYRRASGARSSANMGGLAVKAALECQRELLCSLFTHYSYAVLCSRVSWTPSRRAALRSFPLKERLARRSFALAPLDCRSLCHLRQRSLVLAD